MIVRRNENSASGALVRLFQLSPSAWRAFLTLLPRDFVTKYLSMAHVEFKHLHGTDRGREIDILARSGREGLIIECKVDDAQKPFQLEHYRD